jgi:hypothetical protein
VELADTLQKTFGEIGPVRTCYVVTQNGKSKGIGYVIVSSRTCSEWPLFVSLNPLAQYAMQADAEKAVETLHRRELLGRKIKVEYASQRPKLEERKKKKEDLQAKAGDQEEPEPEPAVRVRVFVSVSMCAHACVCVCTHVCTCVRMCVCVCVCVYACGCLLTVPAAEEGATQQAHHPQPRVHLQRGE